MLGDRIQDSGDEQERFGESWIIGKNLLLIFKILLIPSALIYSNLRICPI